MAAYKFRLQSLLDLRKSIRDQRRVELAQAIAKRETVAAQQREVAEELQGLRGLHRSAASNSQLNVAHLAELQQYEQSLRCPLQVLTSELARWEEEIAIRQATLGAADREAKLLEKLDERHRHEHRQHAEREEAKQLSEQSLLAHPTKLRVPT
jgi:flagellar export protein FliJ